MEPIELYSYSEIFAKYGVNQASLDICKALAMSIIEFRITAVHYEMIGLKIMKEQKELIWHYESENFRMWLRNPKPAVQPYIGLYDVNSVFFDLDLKKKS